ncbi:phosphoribosylamine--glycine ligase [Arthrobacter sp. zg-Y820]|uniref:phosphoribosylamine--glycine ligase n=1 Tax=unclassified Arthrobacter TaxID=235627 RepID=UPI00254232D4|nr:MULTISPECIES: phosphoribosylamine--glycine ligase [unclassified Arthrobacter]MCC9196990.1 phosphoribosylamine--glycine ligase [Arthrobacter sp. zg-Y820]MDK1279855.1 phosphoribosylamine--glycine ligase [Arthrobacter sp. zg.Y820]WIB09160.1 phosphoribosylamine--glycine ligase [Arthrobacter sp. zg-Y820]
MKVLVVGPGGREHALVRSLLADPYVREVHAAPGNAGIAGMAAVHAVNASDPAEVTALARTLGSDLVVIGPEAPLAAGVADALRDAGIPVFGPSKAAAQLEASKAFAKQVMASASVPTAMARVAATAEQAADALDTFGAPYVVKDDGLAAGKGVVVTSDRGAALAHAQACFDAGGTVVIEEFLDGPEVSLFVLSDGRTVVPLAPAQDFKRIYDGDEGPNTGGMGAYSPLDWVPADLVDDVIRRVAQPTIDEMAARGTPFVGVLYCGLALTSRGMRVIEFNARFGDPETQAVLARLKTPLGGLLLAAAKGELDPMEQLKWDPRTAVAVVVAAANYPEAPRTGDRIRGLKKAEKLDGVQVLHAGTRLDGDKVVSAGGRVLAVVGLGQNLQDARDRAYAGVDTIRLDGSQHRTDIALKALRGDVVVPAGSRAVPCPDSDTADRDVSGRDTAAGNMTAPDIEGDLA